MKRVYCLYRVSTKKQVDKNKNDIPMQKEVCREFAAKQGDWSVEREYEEKGISGYKTSASNRDAIQKLKEAALRGEFDILLVFMFDRIGRIDDETPFVVEWFVKQGIEVWSTQEGQQRFENHTDKLLNYIRFWQASGESEKTSIRIKTRIQQMEAAGLYAGGAVKFGYHLVDSGLINKRGYPVKKLEIDAEEAAVVALMDEMTISRGYGSYRLAQYLNERGYRTHTGYKFSSSSVLRILRDDFYCGRLKDGTTSEELQALRIRTDEVAKQLRYILGQRQEKDTQKRQIAFTTRGKALLSGNVYCAHCGGKLTTMRYQDRYTRADGSEYKVDQLKYCCYHKTRKLCDCDGQTTYHADRIDEAVRKIMRNIFSCMKGSPGEEEWNQMRKRRLAGNQAARKRLLLEKDKNKKQLEMLQLEIGKALIGESMYSSSDLTNAIQAVKEKINLGEEQLEKLQEEMELQKQGTEEYPFEYKQFKGWAESFDEASLEQQKMIACQLFERIEVGRGYNISVVLNMTYQQFISEWSDGKSIDEIIAAV